LRVDGGPQTFADLLDRDEERLELLDGEVYMLPAASMAHQMMQVALSSQLFYFLLGGSCKVVTDAGLRLFAKEDNSDDVYFEPDVMVICDSAKITKNTCNGAPDFIIEILSPSNRSWDRFYKFNQYLKAGVGEYWIIDPEEKTVEVHRLMRDSGGRPFYKKDAYRWDEARSVPVTVLPGCEIDLSLIFDETVI
jgi:Uma2 family endonuclease